MPFVVPDGKEILIMPDDPYVRLAAVLDTIPNGFTHIEDGTHLRVLQWIFTPEEADLAGKLKLRGETAEDITTRLDLPMEETIELLESMIEKGQISGWMSRSTGARKYALMPFAVGIYEEQLGRMDEEFAKLVEEYFEKGKGVPLFSAEPPIFKIVPVNKSVSTDLIIHPYEQAEKLIETSASWGVRECICKKQKELIGEPCSYPTTVCISLAPRRENAFDDTELSTSISKEEALKLLRDSAEAGLVHCTMNVQRDQTYICNCCTCCCGVLRGLTEYDQPNAFVDSDFVISVDSDLCSGCGTCVDRCQFGVHSIPEDVSEADKDRCIGCGVCVIECPEDALELVPREGRGDIEPPESLMDWMTKKAISRGVDPSDLL
ncbi:MAG: ATP-binding protein [Candidatus Thorarchaeota archaeon]